MLLLVAWIWTVTAATPPPPAVVTATVTVQLRDVAGSGIVGVRVRALQDGLPAGACTTDSAGRCLLVMTLRPPVIFEPVLVIDGYPFDPAAVAHDGVLLIRNFRLNGVLAFIAGVPGTAGLVEDAGPDGRPLPLVPAASADEASTAEPISISPVATGGLASSQAGRATATRAAAVTEVAAQPTAGPHAAVALTAREPGAPALVCGALLLGVIAIALRRRQAWIGGR